MPRKNNRIGGYKKKKFTPLLILGGWAGSKWVITTKDQINRKKNNLKIKS